MSSDAKSPVIAASYPPLLESILLGLLRRDLLLLPWLSLESTPQAAVIRRYIAGLEHSSRLPPEADLLLLPLNVESAMRAFSSLMSLPVGDDAVAFWFAYNLRDLSPQSAQPSGLIRTGAKTAADIRNAVHVWLMEASAQQQLSLEQAMARMVGSRCAGPHPTTGPHHTAS